MSKENFTRLFTRATEFVVPHPYQERLGLVGSTESRLLNVPTSLGKTAAAVLAWVWRRRFAADEIRERTPRRLVYCLPMRVLGEQTFGESVRWLDRIGLLAGEAIWENAGADGLPTHACQLTRYQPVPGDPRTCGWASEHGDQGIGRIAVHLLMGGEERTDWALWPEEDAVLVGTQDMLLSRALNRGYAARRPRWPMEFGLLNNDCLWVFDEVQLMGPGLATGLQLEAFRTTAIGARSYFETERRCVSWYMSATASRGLLVSREWRENGGDRRPTDFVFELSPEEREDRQGVLGQRRLATKQLERRLLWTVTDDEAAQRIVSRHREMLQALADAPTDVPRRTLVICNRVDRARALHKAVSDALGENAAKTMVLLHSRFRPPDRSREQDRLKAELDVRDGQIVIATQVVEAGVDLSSAILWTEIAPLPSLVQRLGRLNRAGEFGHDGQRKFAWTPVAVLLGIPLPSAPDKPTKDEKEKYERDLTREYLPYGRSDCEGAQRAVQTVDDASPANLETQLRSELDSVLQPPDYSLQRHELLDFFDTDSNLSLGYTDVSPFIRGVDPETDVYVVWRNWEGDSPSYDYDVGRDEICHVPIWQVVGKTGLSTWHQGFVWQGRERGWQPATRDNLFSGATLLLPTSAGGYDDALGWTGTNGEDCPVSELYKPLAKPTDEELLSALEQGWQSIAAHTLDVRSCWDVIQGRLNVGDPQLLAAIHEAIRWHDYGKAIEEWQNAARRVAAEAGLVWPDPIAPVGKFSIRGSLVLRELTGPELQRAIQRLKRTFAPAIRHEVASALALRQQHRQDGSEPTLYDCLAEYLVMAHHGHVRKALRDELPRDPSRLQRGPNEVRGIQEGTAVPGFSAHGDAWPATGSLSIACRQMGRSPDDSESWTRTVLRLLDQFGPFRLAYYEALVRAADCRASAEPSTNVVIASPIAGDEALVGNSERGAKR